MAPFRLCCVVCLYVREGVAPSAVTVINGYAVCDDHVTVVAGATSWDSILIVVRREAT